MLLLLLVVIIIVHWFVQANQELELDSARHCTNNKENSLHPSDLDIHGFW